MNVILFFTSETKSRAPTEEILGAKDIAARMNWLVQAMEMPRTDRALARLLDFWSPIGVIAECGELPANFGLDFGRTPVVYIDRDPNSLPRGSFCVIHDSVNAGETAARHLLMTGCENFAFVPNPERFRWSDDRQRGFADALALNGRRCSVMPVRTAGGALGFQSALRKFLCNLPRPCAVFVANDRPAESVIVQAKLLGLRIPDDVAVLGVDDCEAICDHTSPTLSSVKPDFRRGGSLAALMLAARLRDGAAFRGERLRKYGSLGVTRRASTRKLQTQVDRETADALEFIRTEACNGLRAEAVMARYGCSRPLAAARFRKSTGRTILEEIHAVRLERVKTLLADPGMRLKSISDFCGFASPSTLRKFFLRETGVTMSAWRKTNH